jgi:hypothetical protein
MTNHTPGPWSYHAQQRGILGEPETLRPNGYNVRAVEPVKFGGTPLADVGTTHSATDEANARLIAAAPDLLEAAEAVKAKITGPQVMTVGEANKLLAEVFNLIDPAIAKAKGE